MVTISAPGVTFEQFWVHGAAKNALALEADVVRVHEVYFAIHRPDEVTDPVVTGTGLAGVEISDCMMTSTGALGIFLQDCSQVFVLDNRVDVNPDTETAPIAISAVYTPQEGSYSDIDIEDNEVDGGAIDVSVLSQSGTTLSPDCTTSGSAITWWTGAGRPASLSAGTQRTTRARTGTSCTT